MKNIPPSTKTLKIGSDQGEKYFSEGSVSTVYVDRQKILFNADMVQFL